jgi:hypothetical protein
MDRKAAGFIHHYYGLILVDDGDRERDRF